MLPQAQSTLQQCTRGSRCCAIKSNKMLVSRRESLTAHACWPSTPAAAATAAAAAAAAAAAPVDVATPAALHRPCAAPSAQPARQSCVCRFSNNADVQQASLSSDQGVTNKQQQQQHLVQVSVTTSSSSVAHAVLMRLQRLGHAEVWATSAANHYTAVSGLALAAQQLHKQPRRFAPRAAPQDSEAELLQGLAATAVLTAHDQERKDEQKRRLNKLQLVLRPAQQLDDAVLIAGEEGHISSNRTTSIATILGLMRQQLLVPDDDSGVSSSVRQGASCVVEARGEQAVTRALKAGLSLQAAAGQPLLLRPIAGPVVDIVAEKRGQQRLADGLLLVFCWA